ncbi:MAG: hypothetical protein ACQKBW_09345 [Puniceicoccales bacterium]
MRFITLPVLLLGLATLSTYAQPQAVPPRSGPYTGPVYTRPESKPVPLQMEVVPFTFDGREGTRSELSCALFKATTLQPRHWVKTDIPDTSVAFQATYYPQVKWSISIWAPKRYLPDLSADSMAACVAGLKKSYPEKDQLVINNEGTKYRSKLTPVIFNRIPRTIDYTLTDPETGAVTQRYDTFILYKGSLLEFSIWGPPQEMKSMLGWFSVLLENLSLTTPDTTYDSDTRADRVTLRKINPEGKNDAYGGG